MPWKKEQWSVYDAIFTSKNQNRKITLFLIMMFFCHHNNDGYEMWNFFFVHFKMDFCCFGFVLAENDFIFLVNDHEHWPKTKQKINLCYFIKAKTEIDLWYEWRKECKTKYELFWNHDTTKNKIKWTIWTSEIYLEMKK